MSTFRQRHYIFREMFSINLESLAHWFGTKVQYCICWLIENNQRETGSERETEGQRGLRNVFFQQNVIPASNNCYVCLFVFRLSDKNF